MEKQFDLLDFGFFRLARNVRNFSDCRVKVGAVVVNKKPVGVGCNKLKTHPTHANPSNSFRTSIHAEIRAIINCGEFDLSGSSVYVYRETKEGTPAIARPCNYCYNYLKSLGVKKIFYTISEYPFWRAEYL